MNILKQWWANDLSTHVKLVYLVLLANAVPAFIILMSLPSHTELLFVWTIRPEINAHLIGIMYSNALLMIGFGIVQTTWAQVRITMVVITLFSILATLLTFVYLKPFLAHPWFHLAYWLTMYLILFFFAPYVFISHERRYGGRLAVQIPLNLMTRILTSILLFGNLILALGLLFRIDIVNQLLAWTLPPLVGGLIGVLLTTHTAAYAWALWDGDWLRVRPIYWQLPPTGILLILLPIVHASELKPDTGLALTLYWVFIGLAVLASFSIILSYRNIDKGLVNDAQQINSNFNSA